MKKRLIAFLTSGLMLTGAANIPPAMAADVPAEDPIFGVLPDWVPQDFADAMLFYNEYGKSHVEDNIICLVRPMLQFKEDDYQFSIGGTMTYINTPANSIPVIYELDIPEKPDKSDEAAVAAYEEYCDKLGLDSYDYDFFEAYASCKTQYAFEVELFRVFEGYDLSVVWSEKTGDEQKVTETFRFENKNGVTAETDIYSWLPDSQPEYKAFVKEYGKTSVHGNYLAYCADVNASTGASLTVEQTGDGQIKEYMRSGCNGFHLVSIEGSGSSSVIVYEPSADGSFDMTWKVGRTWSEEEPFETTSGSYTVMNDCSAILDRTPGREGTSVITFVDKDTGELIPEPDPSDRFYLLKTTIQSPQTGEIYDITSNPLTVDSVYAYSTGWTYSINMASDAGRYDAPEFEMTLQTSDRAEVICRVKWYPSGDANGDSAFGISDAVVVQEWLLGIPDVKLKSWEAVDFCHDGRLDICDLCAVKQELVKRNAVGYVEPDNYIEWGTILSVANDGLKMYLGPGESYGYVTSLPAETILRELGYQDDDDNWMFTKYNDQYGWIKTVNDDGSPTVYYMAVADKPVIYLYPEEETDVHVELELTESELSTTYPRYNNGWDVTAYPDGTLLNNADGTHHRYLFWDAVNCRTRFDFSAGFCVAGADTESFLREKLTYMGLTEDEMNEFIVYWLPRMEHNAYNLIAFQGDVYTDSAKLSITPAPDSLLRVFMAYVPLEDAVSIAPQQLETFDRNGFAAVEWGGCEVRT